MKKILLFTILAVTVNSSQAQKSKNSPGASTNEELQRKYLSQSKSQKAGGYFLLAVGLATGLLGGIAVALDNDFGGSSSSTYGPLFAVSGASLAGSTLFFIGAAKNKKNANSFSFHLQLERTPNIQDVRFTTRSFRTVAIRYNF